jgi:predicted membrane channel-forming protein YqfA (hemolysin III family)
VCLERDWSRVRPPMLQMLVLGTLQLVAVARFSDTLDFDTVGAWLYVGFVVSLLAVGVYGTRRVVAVRGFRTAPA